MNKHFGKMWFFGFWGIFAFIALSAVFGGAVMLLWNALLPGIAGLPAINYLQAVGILFLTRILFGGFGFGGGSHRMPGSNKFREKWTKMSPKERGEFFKKYGHYQHPFGEGFCGTGERETTENSSDQNNEEVK